MHLEVSLSTLRQPLQLLSLINISFISNCYFAYRYIDINVSQPKALVAGAILLAMTNNIFPQFAPRSTPGSHFNPGSTLPYNSDVRSNQLSVVISPTETSSPIQANKTIYLGQTSMQQTSMQQTSMQPTSMQNYYSNGSLPSTSAQTTYLGMTPVQNQNSTTIPSLHQSTYHENEQHSNIVIDEYQFRAKAMYDCNPEDRTELSFVKGDYLDIASKEGKWWRARKADGTTGIAPSNYAGKTLRMYWFVPVLVSIMALFKHFLNNVKLFL
ncbi:8583_t:CDS:2 [Racocetra fulgida]|uniref:8583_t:CDS:1 n=1 Tax=Racocetra fulgida TaxID=60492 RepID=A0A9N8VCF2_9GLOM|nr:8583_t:CDS:2 [Racocetra fulgida]